MCLGGAAAVLVLLPPAEASEEDLRLMRRLDEQYTATPFYGSRRMQVALQRAGYE